MKQPFLQIARRAGAFALAAVMGLGSVAAVGYNAALTASAAETDISKDAPAGTTLVSRGAAVTISACTNERKGAENSYEMPGERWTKTMLTDGIVGNGGWSCQPYDREMDHTKPVTVTLALPTRSEVSTVSLYAPQGFQFPADYDIQVSTDGVNFTTVASDRDIPIDNTETKVYTFEKTEATHIRLHIIERNPAKGKDGALAQLAELAVFGVAQVSMSLPRTSIELLVGETDQLLPSFSGTNTPLAVTYRSDDSSIVSVAANGTLTAKKLGKTTVSVTCTATGETASCTVAVVEKKYDFDENIMLSIFWPPTKDFITDEQYKLLADAGITWVMGAGEETLATVENQQKMLELCAKYGMGMTVSDGNFGGSLLNKSEAEIAKAVSRYKNVPAAYGFYILDEPMNPNAYIDAYIALKKAAPDAYMHLNFLPSGCYSSEQIYKAQMNDWCRLTAEAGYPLDYLMFDRYPFPLQAGAMDRAGFFANLRSCYEVGLKNDVKTGLYIQTVCQQVAFRRPTDAEIRYEMYASLAFGYKQLSFFTWFTPSNRSEPFTDGIIAADGTPNAHYETVKTINHEILTIGTTLVKCDALGVYFNGTDTYGQPSVPKDFFVQADKSDSAILSWMRHKETGRNYLMVVNNNFSKEQEITLTFDKAIKSLSEVSRTDGSLKALTMDGQTLTVTLAAGDALFIALPEGFDYYDAPEGQPEASVNLAGDALITCSESVGADGWYMFCLNDGERLSGSAGNGWCTAGTDPASILIDLGRTLSFNRLDLYAAGTIFDYGTTFPAALKVSVSADGEAFTEVKALTDLKPDGTKGMEITLGDQNARYIRIDLTKAAKGAKNMALCEVEVYNDDGSLSDPERFNLLSDDDQVITYRDGDNIALGKKSFVSSTTNDAVYKQWGWSQEYINDGKYDNGWTSNVGRNTSPVATEFVGIQFGDLFAVEKIVISDFGAFPEAYEVALSADGLNWVTVHSETRAADKQSGTKVEIELDTPVNARFVRFMGTKLRGGGNDGYLLQLGEIEAYGKPVCDRSVLQNAIDTYKTEGGDTTAKEYTAAVEAMENEFLTQTQANDYAKKLLAVIGLEPGTSVESDTSEEPIQTTSDEPDTSVEPVQSTPADATTANGTEAATKPADSRGCASATSATAIGAGSVLALLGAGAASLTVRKKKED